MFGFCRAFKVNCLIIVCFPLDNDYAHSEIIQKIAQLVHEGVVVSPSLLVSVALDT